MYICVPLGAWCSRRPEEAIGLPGIGVTDVRGPLREGERLNPGPLGEPSLQPLGDLIFFFLLLFFFFS